MSSKAKNKSEKPDGPVLSDAEKKQVKSIIDKLKSQGLFDQFRKQFVADVDTKPAFQNLRQRVEGYVNRFLSRQVWSPDLNKNQLRDNLRKQINQSGMLANGVQRVIEQVVNPKILHIIKPQLDEVICRELDIDPEKRKADQEQKEKQQKQNLQNMMNNLNEKSGPQTPQTPVSMSSGPLTPFGSPPMMPMGFTAESWQQQSPQQQQAMLGSYQQGFMNFPMAMPFPPQYQTHFPGMQGQWNQVFPNFSTPPPQLPGAKSVSEDTSTSSTNNPPLPSTPAVSTQSTIIAANVDTPTPPKSLPPLPPAPSTPPPPGTEEEGDEPHSPPSPMDLDEEEEEEGKIEEDNPSILDDIPLPALPPTPQKESAMANKKKMSLMTEDDDSQNAGDGFRQYKFAWRRDVDEMSDVSVSTVHTSDLSNFASDLESEMSLSDDDIPAPMYSPHGGSNDDVSDTDAAIDAKLNEELKAKDEKEAASDDASEMPVLKEAVEMPVLFAENESTESKTPTPKLKEVSVGVDLDTSQESPPDIVSETELEPPSLVKDAATPDRKKSDRQKDARSVESTNVTGKKPRRLISLQYNYSDSEDEETREERKLRIAKEKEERYVQRLKRRAELEARKKEKEEERNRLKEERRKAKEMKSPDSMTMASPVKQKDIREEKTTPGSPDKKKKKTKEELKEELTKQKVQEKREALRRHRTRNKKYVSEEFTSIFTEKKTPFSSQNYNNDSENVVVEEMTVEATIETVVMDMDMVVMEEDVPGSDLMVGEQQVILSEDTGGDLTIEAQAETIDYIGSPATPTQDENQMQIVEDSNSSIPVYEATFTAASVGRVGQPVHHTRSRSKINDDIKSNTSDVSDRSDSARGRRRRTNSGPQRNIETADPRTRRGRQRNTSSPSAGQRRSSPPNLEPSNRQTESEKQKAKRYDTSDLYKPHRTFSSRRRGSSPIKPEQLVETYAKKSSKSAESSSVRGKQMASSLDDTSPISSRSSSRSGSQVHPAIREASPISSSSSFSSKSKSRSRSRSKSTSRSRSRSHSRSPLGSHSRSRSPSKSGSESHKSGSSGHGSRAGSHSSSSSVDEFGRRKRKNQKTPIDLVDFGEAAKMVKKSLDHVDFGEAERRLKMENQGVKRGFRGRGAVTMPRIMRGGAPMMAHGGRVSRGGWDGPPGEGQFWPTVPGGRPEYDYDMPYDRSPSPVSPGPEDSPPPRGMLRKGRPTSQEGSPPYPYPRRPGSPSYRRGSQDGDSPGPYGHGYASPPPRARRSPSQSEGSSSRSPSPLYPPRVRHGSPPKEHFPVERRKRRLERSPSLEQVSRSPTPEYPPRRPLGGRPLSRSPSLENISRSPTPPYTRMRKAPPSPPPSSSGSRGRRVSSRKSPSPISSEENEPEIIQDGPQSPSPSPSSSSSSSVPPSPPHRPLTRGHPTSSPESPEEGIIRGHKRAPSSPPLPMSHRLRTKHNAPDRFSPPVQETRRFQHAFPEGHPPAKKGKKG